MKKASIIVPVFNGEKHLEKCIRSILKQTYPSFELIIIDDGSTDNSLSLCESFSKKDKRISVFHKENGGVSSARNFALDKISGDYVLFIDADDYLDEDMLEFLVDLLEKNQADISQCGYRRIIGDTIRPVNDTQKTYILNQEESLGYLITGKLFASGLWNKLFRSSIISSLRFDPEIAINEDVLFSFYAFCNVRKTVFSDYLKYNYVAFLGESAIFNTKKEKKITDVCKVNELIYHKVYGNAVLQTKAANRYLSSLFRKYRYFTKEKKDKQSIQCVKSEIKKISKENKEINRKMKLSCFLISFFPLGYKIVYSIYDKKRKPNWDVEVD